MKLPTTLLAASVAIAVGAGLLSACAGKPSDLKPVTPFEAQRYLGKWYEIARLDNRFERGLEHITAEYSLRPDGGIKVLNRGYDMEKKAWKQSEGKAYFVEGPERGYLKVSFFGPIYGAYVVIDLDPAYQVSLVGGGDKSYLWILARTPTIDDATRARLLEKARALGFATDKLIFVDQSAG